MTLPAMDPMDAFDFSDTLGDQWSPDNWLVDQVGSWATPEPPQEGMSTRNEPHTVTAPLGASAGDGQLSMAIDKAMSYLGTMYDWGGTGVNGRGVDCSGLIYAAYRAAGFNIDRYRAMDYGRMGTAVGAEDARAGDIVYFDNPDSETDHVGIYLGNGKFIESPTPGQAVRISSLESRPATSIRRIVADSAYRGMPRDAAGSIQYHAGDNKVYTSAKAPGPQRDPLDILEGIDEGLDIDPLLGLPPELQEQIAAQTPVGGQETPEGSTPTGNSFAAFLGAVSGQESGGDYNVQNSIGAIGKYQVMYYNVGPWTLQALGRTMTPQEFRYNPQAQDAVARWRLGNYVAQYGYRGAAAAWYSGNPSRANDYTKLSNGSGPSVGDYVDQVMARMGL